MFALQAVSPQSGPSSSILGTIGVLLVVGFFLYLYLGITLMLIARRSNTSYSGLAFLPIINLFLMCRIGRRPGWWVLLLLLPVINVAVFAMIWMSIAEVRGKPVWTGALAAVPLLGLIVPLYFAIGKTPLPGTVAARICTTCGTPILGVESFCRNCGQAAPAPILARRASTGKLALIGAFTSVIVVALVGGVAWFTLFRGLSYTAPDRKPPAIPERLAGTMTEFPVDTKSDGSMEPSSVITEDLGAGGSTSSSQRVPQKWLPPGVTRARLPQSAGTMTSAAYRPRRRPGATTESAVDQVYVHVLRALQNQVQQLIDELARSVTQATGGTRSGVRVQSPGGVIYTGSR